MAESPEHDPAEQRAHTRDAWERGAGAWGSVQERLGTVGMPVSRWMIDAIEPQPGQRVLELAAGTGDTGFLAAELVQPGGTLVCSDGAEAMLEQARRRAQQLGVANVEFKRLELEWIDIEAASVDAVLCRWGYMFAVDRGAAFRETRRVLRPGGRVALATWAALERNPWAGLRAQAIAEAGHPGAPPPSAFDIGTDAVVRGLLEEAGFTEIETAEIEVAFLHDNFDDYWTTILLASRHFAQLVEGLDASAVAALRERLVTLVEPFTDADGRLRLPGVALGATAGA